MRPLISMVWLLPRSTSATNRPSSPVSPLFTRWANLSVWMPVYEWYNQFDGTGSGAGDVYISTDIQVLHNEWFHSDKAKYIAVFNC